MSKPIVPVLAFTVVLALALALIVGIILRPWGQLAGTFLNLGIASAQVYYRSEPTFVGANAPVRWSHNSLAAHSPAQLGKAYFVAHGCASCHGLEGKGTQWAPMEPSSAGQVRLMVRTGPGGMPVYPKDYLPDEYLDLITSWLVSQGAVVEKPEATPTPTPVPTPTPAPTPTPPGPAPAPGPTATPGAITQATPTAAATPTPTPTPTPAPLQGDASRGQPLYTEKRCARCHGKDGSGSELAPALNTAKFHEKFATDADLAQMVRKGAGDMDGYDAKRLTDQELADIIAYVRSLRPQ